MALLFFCFLWRTAALGSCLVLFWEGAPISPRGVENGRRIKVWCAVQYDPVSEESCVVVNS